MSDIPTRVLVVFANFTVHERETFPGVGELKSGLAEVFSCKSEHVEIVFDRRSSGQEYRRIREDGSVVNLYMTIAHVYYKDDFVIDRATACEVLSEFLTSCQEGGYPLFHPNTLSAL